MANTIPTQATGRKFGYARVSTTGQDEALQLDALKADGIAKRDIYTDRGVSGAKTSRPKLDEMLSDIESGDIEPGDVLTVWKLDRLGRNSGHVISLLKELVDKGVHVRSISDGLDTTTPTGRAMLGMLAIFAEMERGFIQERTRAGLASAKAQGRTGGRPRAMGTKDAALAQRLYNEGEKVADIAKTLKVSVPTIYRYLNAAE